MSVFSQLHYAVADRVATITFQRPNVLNAFSRTLYREIARAVLLADADSEVEVIVLTGAGRAFGTGGDLKELQQLYADDDRVGISEFAQVAYQLFTTLEATRKTIIARVNGPAHAGGLVAVLCCDLAIATSSATFGVPEALVGQADPFVATRLPLRIGLARAKLMMFTAQTIDAPTAESWGLVNTVVPDEELDAAVQELIARLRQTSPQGRSLYKSLAHAPLPPFDLATLRAALLSEEAVLGARAFVDQQPAPWMKRS